MPCVKLCVTIDTAPRTQERTQSVQKGMPTLEHGHDGALQDASHPSHSSPDPIVPYAPAKKPIAPRTPALTPIVPHAPRGNVARDALRAPRTQRGRRASRKACPRWSMGTMVLFRTRLIPHTQALTLSSRTRQPRHPSLLALQPGHLSFLTLRVGMPFVTLCVTPTARQAPAKMLQRSPGCRVVDQSSSSCAVR